MKHAGLSSLVLGSAAAAALFAIATGAGAEKSKEPNIYYKSHAAADAALEKFDKDNPSCQLWTNWQKMCSRTGLKGETLCASDSTHRAKPSKPFCSFRPIFRSGFSHYRESEVPEVLTEGRSSSNSRNRFCAEFADKNQDYHYGGFEKQIAKRIKKVSFCRKYLIDRPFNGLSREYQKSPRCKQWNKLESGLYYCASKIEDKFCNSLNNGVRPLEVTEDGIVVGKNYYSEEREIWGLWCNKKIGVK
jgi:hypothetical protein